MVRCSASCRKSGLHHTWQWLGKTYTITPNIHVFLLPPALFAERHTMWNVPGVSWGQLSHLCPLPPPCALPASLMGWCKEQKRPCHCVSFWLSVRKAFLCYQHSSQHKSKTQPCIRSLKKITSSQTSRSWQITLLLAFRIQDI